MRPWKTQPLWHSPSYISLQIRFKILQPSSFCTFGVTPHLRYPFQADVSLCWVQLIHWKWVNIIQTIWFWGRGLNGDFIFSFERQAQNQSLPFRSNYAQYTVLSPGHDILKDKHGLRYLPNCMVGNLKGFETMSTQEWGEEKAKLTKCKMNFAMKLLCNLLRHVA